MRKPKWFLKKPERMVIVRPPVEPLPLLGCNVDSIIDDCGFSTGVNANEQEDSFAEKVADGSLVKPAGVTPLPAVAPGMRGRRLAEFVWAEGNSAPEEADKAADPSATVQFDFDAAAHGNPPGAGAALRSLMEEKYPAGKIPVSRAFLDRPDPFQIRINPIAAEIAAQGRIAAKRDRLKARLGAIDPGPCHVEEPLRDPALKGIDPLWLEYVSPCYELRMSVPEVDLTEAIVAVTRLGGKISKTEKSGPNTFELLATIPSKS